MQGETLYAVAWQANTDYQTLAKINGMLPPYTLQVGQRLCLRTPCPLRPPTHTFYSSSRVWKPNTKKTVNNKAAISPSTADPIQSFNGHFQWPAHGPLIGQFQPSDTHHKGIEIAGMKNAPVLAAAGGKVVYAGDRLRGYGRLVIIKHNPIYLTAYAHNNKILVREGQVVKAGQQIAGMGNSGAKRVQLYFEIRKKGQPVDPLLYLPKR